MNYMLPFFLAIVYFFIIYLLWIQLKKLKDEVSFLPKKVENIPIHPLVGSRIQELHNFGRLSLNNSITILIFSDTTCPYCSVALEEFIQKIHIPFGIPFKVVLQAANENERIDYVNLYGDYFEVIEHSDKFIKIFKLTQFPTFVVLDQQGTVVQVVGSTNEILKSHFQTLKSSLIQYDKTATN